MEWADANEIGFAFRPPKMAARGKGSLSGMVSGVRFYEAYISDTCG
jgi:hypothetical protein